MIDSDTLWGDESISVKQAEQMENEKNEATNNDLLATEKDSESSQASSDEIGNTAVETGNEKDGDANANGDESAGISESDDAKPYIHT